MGICAKKALELGTEPVTPKRTSDVLSHIEHRDKIELLIAPGRVGERYIKAFDMPSTVIGTVGEETSAEDIRRMAQEMIDDGIELLILVGGDGTA